MNFDDIKKEMNESIDQLPKDEFKIDLSKGKNNPVHMIRRNMKKEIIFVIFGIILFLAYPSILDKRGIEMSSLARSAYMIFMSLSGLMMALYILKLLSFIRKSSNFQTNTRDSIKDYIYEIRLTLESYKSYVIASSLLIPIPVFALLGVRNGWDASTNFEFERWFNLQLNNTETILLVVSYLVFSVFFYWSALYWTNYLYGKHVTELEKIVSDLDAVD